MRVLFAVPFPIPVSESYIRNEIEWMERQGVEIGIWTTGPRQAKGYEDLGRYLAVATSFADTVRQWRPDLVHAHSAVVAAAIVDDTDELGVPLTIRAHPGKEISWQGNLLALVQHPSVACLWHFPHFARKLDSPKAEALPVLYEPLHYFPGTPAQDRHVFRAGAGLPGKGIEEHIEIARLLPDVRFVLVLADTDRSFVVEICKTAPANVSISLDLDRPEVTALMRGAWVCLRGHDLTSHPYGMPISIVEAMGTGLPVIARWAPEAEEYIGDAGLYYETVSEAAHLIERVRSWDVSAWKAASEKSRSRAMLFSTDRLLPAVLSRWEKIVSSAGSRTR